MKRFACGQTVKSCHFKILSFIFILGVIGNVILFTFLFEDLKLQTIDVDMFYPPHTFIHQKNHVLVTRWLENEVDNRRSTDNVTSVSDDTNPPLLILRRTTNTSDAELEKTWEMMKNRRLARFTTCNNCFKLNIKYDMSGNSVCGAPVFQGSEIYLLILITTVHGHRQLRDTIRRTWLEKFAGNSQNVRYAFLLGRSAEVENETIHNEVKQESNTFKDLVVGDFIDSYYNLTIKTLFGFKWALDYCPRAKYIMKTDEDVFVNITSLLKVIQKHRTQLQTRVIGSCALWPRVNRNPKSKWNVPREVYSWQYLPPHCSGTGYILSMETARKVYEISLNVPFFSLEDVYVGLCLVQLKRWIFNVQGFHRGIPKCVYKNGTYITIHFMNTDILNVLWKNDVVCVKIPLRNPELGPAESELSV